MPWLLLGALLSAVYLAAWPAAVNGDGIGYLKAARAGVRYPGHLAYLPLLSSIWRALRGADATSLASGVLPGRVLSALSAGLCVAALGALVALRTADRWRGLCACLGLGASSGFVLVACDLESYAPALLALCATLLFLELERPALAGLALAAATLLHIENALFFLPAIAYARAGRGWLVAVAGAIVGPAIAGFVPQGGVLAATHGFHYPLHVYTPLVAAWGALRAFVYTPYPYEASFARVALGTATGAGLGAALALMARMGARAGRSLGLSRAVLWSWIIPYSTVGALFFASDSERWLFLLPLFWIVIAQLAAPRGIAVVIVCLLACDLVLWLPHARDHRAVDRARAAAAALAPGELVISPGHGWDESIPLFVEIEPFPLVFHAAARGGAAGLSLALDEAIADANARHVAVRIVRVFDADDPSGTLGYKELATFGIDRAALRTLFATKGLVTPP